MAIGICMGKPMGISTKTQPAFECYIKRFGHKNHSNVDINKVDKRKYQTIHY